MISCLLDRRFNQLSHGAEVQYQKFTTDLIKLMWHFDKQNVSPNVGLEPTTLRLRVSCSTDWASRAVQLNWQKISSWLQLFCWYWRQNDPVCIKCLIYHDFSIVASARPAWPNGTVGSKIFLSLTDWLPFEKVRHLYLLVWNIFPGEIKCSHVV